MSMQNGCRSKTREIRKEDALLYIKRRHEETKNLRQLSPLNVISDIPTGRDIFFATVARGICRWGTLVEEAIPGVKYNEAVLGLGPKKERDTKKAGPLR